MFKRENSPGPIETLIGKSSRISGDVVFAGGLHIDGHVAGSVRADGPGESTLSVSESGFIDGGIEAANVQLDGAVRGDIVASGRVVLGATARVEGNVHYGTIEMTVGARIMGKLVRLEPEGGASASAASG